MQALQSLSVDRSMEQEKQKAEVKHFLLQKQRALADLFKMLAQIGQSESFLVVLENLLLVMKEKLETLLFNYNLINSKGLSLVSPKVITLSLRQLLNKDE